MAGDVYRIQLFKFSQKVCRLIGVFSSEESNRNNHDISLKSLVFIFCFMQYCISTLVHLLFHANSMIEYGMVFFLCSSTFQSTIFYLTFFWQMNDILGYIENCERFIEKSECWVATLTISKSLGNLHDNEQIILLQERNQRIYIKIWTKKSNK